MIEVHGLSVRYGERIALENVSLSIYSGEILAIVGANGSGKSTLLRTLLRLQEPDEGVVLLDGENMAGMSAREIARKIAYLPQSRNLPNTTAGTMVLHGRFPYLSFPRRYRKEDYEIVEEALRSAGASELSKRPMSELSGGQRQKVYVAMALAQQTETILMDEPTTYLDIRCQIELMETAKMLARQHRSVVMVLHDLCLAMRYADRLAVLDEGRVAQIGTPEEIYASAIIEQTFHARLRRTHGADGWRYYYD